MGVKEVDVLKSLSILCIKDHLEFPTQVTAFVITDLLNKNLIDQLPHLKTPMDVAMFSRRAAEVRR